MSLVVGGTQIGVLNHLQAARATKLHARALQNLARKCIQLVRPRSQPILSVENIMGRELDARLSNNALKRLMPEHADTSGWVTCATRS
ncbi:hypothetical protein [Nitrosomonas nitrosa]|uniref:hypothetical protein n=1 Tax=Nitrosomonas nitrosa TaxID=52442 RepID=UPI000D317695|nr:hypothetical protein [Nitrosomonas nitrosa]